MGGGSNKLINSSLFKNYSFNSEEYEKLTEQELVEKIKKGDEIAEKYLYTRYSNIVKRIVSAFFIIGGDKDDLFQEAMIGLVHAVNKYNCNINDNFRYFAELCIRRQIITAIRNSKGYEKNLLNNCISLYEYSNLEQENNLLDKYIIKDCLNPENVIMIKEEINNYYYIKAKFLSNFERAVLTEYENGKTYQEISIALKKDIKSVENALQRVRKKINKNRENLSRQ